MDKKYFLKFLIYNSKSKFSYLAYFCDFQKNVKFVIFYIELIQFIIYLFICVVGVVCALIFLAFTVKIFIEVDLHQVIGYRLSYVSVIF